MTKTTITPQGEKLRNAIRWLSEQVLHPHSIADQTLAQTVEQASLMFDLTPLEEEFLIRKFVEKKDAPKP